MLPLKAGGALVQQLEVRDQHAHGHSGEEDEEPEDGAEEGHHQADVTQHAPHQRHGRDEVEPGDAVVREDVDEGIGKHVGHAHHLQQRGPEDEDEEEALVVDPDARPGQEAVVVPLQHAALAQRAVVAAGRAETLAHEARRPRPVRERLALHVAVLRRQSHGHVHRVRETVVGPFGFASGFPASDILAGSVLACAAGVVSGVRGGPRLGWCQSGRRRPVLPPEIP